MKAFIVKMLTKMMKNENEGIIQMKGAAEMKGIDRPNRPPAARGRMQGGGHCHQRRAEEATSACDVEGKW
jgi:hypothetical protein